MRKEEKQNNTLGVLVHGARWRPHPCVAPCPHPHPLHLVVAGVIRHALLMHGIHWLQEGGNDKA